MKAKYILHNGRFYTSNEKMDWAEAVAIGGGVFLQVGTTEECQVFRGKNTEMINLEGRIVLPGLIDSHTHPATIAKSRWRIQVPEFDTKEKLLSWVKEYCDSHPIGELPYFFGESYPSEMFDEKGPRKEWLDEYVSDRPVRLQDFTDHACWFNSKALELMGITSETEETGTAPFFVRDENNEPTGWVHEPLPGLSFETPMYEAIGWYPPEKVTEDNVKPFLDKLNDWGVTAIGDGITEGEDAMKLFYDMDQQGMLKLYYDGMCLLESYDKLEECIATIRDWQTKYTGMHTKINTVKFFMDQTNEMGTGASLEPHRNDSSGNNFGEMNMSEEELTDVLLRLNKERLDLHVHVVCDRSFRTCCDAYEAARKLTEDSGKSWDIHMILAHCELVHPDDMKRPGELGILINWSPHWAGGYFGEAAMEYLGRERWESMYDFTKIIESGAIVSYSSDVIGMCEEDRADPFFGMEISVRRVDLEDPLDPNHYPESVRPPVSAKLTVEELVKGYTRYGAIPLRWEDKLGTIEAGKVANLTVLNKDIFNISETEICTVKPDIVMFDGEIIRNVRT